MVKLSDELFRFALVFQMGEGKKIESNQLKSNYPGWNQKPKI